MNFSPHIQAENDGSWRDERDKTFHSKVSKELLIPLISGAVIWEDNCPCGSGPISNNQAVLTVLFSFYGSPTLQWSVPLQREQKTQFSSGGKLEIPQNVSITEHLAFQRTPTFLPFDCLSSELWRTMDPPSFIYYTINLEHRAEL